MKTRTYYISADELVKEIVIALVHFRVVTISTSNKWWTKGLVTPYSKNISENVIEYNGVATKELLKALRDKGLIITPHSKVNHFYYIRNDYERMFKG